MNTCSECGRPITQTPHRRPRYTCSSTCRGVRARRRQRAEYDALLAAYREALAT